MPKQQAEVSAQLDEAKPELLVCSPECKHWGGQSPPTTHGATVGKQETC